MMYEMSFNREDFVKMVKSGASLRHMNLKGADLGYLDLTGANLSGIKLCDANLSCAKLCKANLRGADLSGANLSNADMNRTNLESATLIKTNLIGAFILEANLKLTTISNATFTNANLYRANFTRSTILHTSFCYSNLTDARLENSYLREVDFSKAGLEGANFHQAYLDNVKLDGIITDFSTSFLALQCPEEGSYIGYKKCREDLIVKLLIPEHAKRSSATSRKCRASEAVVLSITNLDGTPANTDVAFGFFDESFAYKVGEVVKVDNFDPNRWHACASGIHHFITRGEAVNFFY